MVSRHRLTLGFALALVGCASGCGSQGSPPTVVDADFYSCADETRATPYQPGMSVMSRDARFVVKVLDSTWTDASGKVTSEPPAKGTNVWTLEVDDAATSQPMDGVLINVTPRMPDHRHGTTTVTVTPMGAGHYTVNPLYLYMAGYWEITLDLNATSANDGGAADPPDSAQFRICVSG